jgi:hypothetical protein
MEDKIPVSRFMTPSLHFQDNSACAGRLIYPCKNVSITVPYKKASKPSQRIDCGSEMAILGRLRHTLLYLPHLT